MASHPTQDMSDYPRPWFYRPEVYYGFIIFPPVWSILTLRSPWHKGEGFMGIMIGGLAWFFLIASVVMAVKWVQTDDDGNRHILNLFIFVPGVLLTLLTQVQWAAHRARHGPPPTEIEGGEDPDESGDESSAVQRTGLRHRLFIFVPGVLLTLLTQVQWAAHRSRHGPPPTETEEEVSTASPASPEATASDLTPEDSEDPDESGGEASAADRTGLRRRRRRRRRPISRSADPPPLC